MPVQLELFPRRACLVEAKPATECLKADHGTFCRDGVGDGGTRERTVKITGEALNDPSIMGGRQVYKGSARNHGSEVVQGVGGGHSTDEGRDNRLEERAAASTKRSKRGKVAGLHPRGKAQSRRKAKRHVKPQRMDKARKLQRTLYRTAKSQPERRFTLLYDKVYREDILALAWKRVKKNRGAAGIDKIDIETVMTYGQAKFLNEIRQSLIDQSYRVSRIRRVYIPKPGQPGRTRPLGIPVLKDRVVQMAVKIVIEPLFEADFRPCSCGFRPKKGARVALSKVATSINQGYHHVVDVDLRSYFDTIDHEVLLGLVGRRVSDNQITRLIRAWLRAGIVEEGKVRDSIRGVPQGGVISPLLSNIYLHEIDRLWCGRDGTMLCATRLIRYADDMILLARSSVDARHGWNALRQRIKALRLEVNLEKSRLMDTCQGFRFLGFEYRWMRGNLYMWPCSKAVKHIYERIRQTVYTVPRAKSVQDLVKQLNPVIRGWCTYFRVGNSNRAFHKVDWRIRYKVHQWLRRKHNCTTGHAGKRWPYRVLYSRYRLYRLVGKVSHLEGLRMHAVG